MTPIARQPLSLGGRDPLPYLVLPALMVLALAAMKFSAWLTLTVAGLAVGCMLFLAAIGLTLIFGLMDVLNFAHGGFVTLGAFIVAAVFAALPASGGGAAAALGVVALALAAAAVAGGGLGLVFERLLIRRVAGAPLRQILITVGGGIILQQMLIVLFGAEPLALPRPEALRGGFIIAGAAVERYRLMVCLLGLVVYAATHLALNRTRLGLLIRAAVENREMVEALGFRAERLFRLVFAAGTALAAIGGVVWALYAGMVTADLGADIIILIFIVVIIGGLGSVSGCFLASLLLGLANNYVGFLAPKLALGTDIALMLIVLLWRPRGLLPMDGA